MGLLDLFIERKPETKSTAATPGQPAPIVFNTSPVNTAPTVSATTNEADLTKFVAHFDELFDKSNLPGPDYYEFSKMFQAINAPGMSEDTRMAAAFAGLGVQGLTKEKLLQTAQQYINIIEEDSKNFEQAVGGKINQELNTKKNAAIELSAKVTEKQNLIAQLQKEITDDNLNIQRMNQEVAEQEAEIASKVNGYKTACESRKQQIASDIQKITTYIK
jgi:predicted phage tail protein